MNPTRRTILLLAAVILVIALALSWGLRLLEQPDAVELSADSAEELKNQELVSKGPELPKPSFELTSRTATATIFTQPATSEKQIIQPTFTPIPTRTPVPTPTTTQSPSVTNSPSPSVTPKPTDIIQTAALLDGIDRSCPDPAPAKPDYQHYYLSGQPWPKPVENPQDHFWLSKPLPGGGRLLYTDWLPYGNDAGGRYLLHNGVDVADPMGTPLLAAADGQVVVAGPDAIVLYGWRCDWYGNLVVIELDQQWGGNPVYLLYGHVLEISVAPGQHVQQGDQLAEVGFGGAAGTPHLHFEVRVGTNEFQSTRNPFLWLRPPDTRGIVVGRLIDPQGRPWQGVGVTAVGRSENTENKTTWTYLGDPQSLIKPDEEFAENFVIPDLRSGTYELYVELQGETYQVPVEVQGGQMVRAEIITEAFKTPAPEPTSLPQVSPIETPTPEG